MIGQVSFRVIYHVCSSVYTQSMVASVCLLAVLAVALAVCRVGIWHHTRFIRWITIDLVFVAKVLVVSASYVAKVLVVVLCASSAYWTLLYKVVAVEHVHCDVVYAVCRLSLHGACKLMQTDDVFLSVFLICFCSFALVYDAAWLSGSDVGLWLSDLP